MSERTTTRRRVLQAGAAATAIGLAGCADETEEIDASYEIWAFDQGTDVGYIYRGNEDGEVVEDDTLDLHEILDDVETDDDIVPHMVDFNSTHEYAAVACTAGARTLVFDVEDHELVADLSTGAGSHFAGFTPDDEYIQVDVIGDEKIVQIDADVDAGTFEIGDELVVAEDSTYAEREDDLESSSPVCHDVDDNGYSYHTLGPSIDGAGVAVLDIDSFSFEKVFTPEELRANCGTFKDPERDQLFLTGGAPSNHGPTGGVSEWYVLDTDAQAPIDHDGNVLEDDVQREDVVHEIDGYDAHGFWFAGDELFILNRETHDGVVVDPETYEVIEEVDDYGVAPDILWGTPDDNYLFATLRGPNPVSGDPHAAEGETPGFSVFDVESREVTEVIEPDPDNGDSDFHGIAGRPL